MLICHLSSLSGISHIFHCILDIISSVPLPPAVTAQWLLRRRSTGFLDFLRDDFVLSVVAKCRWRSPFMYLLGAEERDLHGVLFYCILLFIVLVVRLHHVVKGPHRIRLFLRALVLYRNMFPGKHRRGGRDVERSMPHLCWFEAYVKQEAVFGTDERSTEFGITGFMLLSFMTTHLFHVSFASACRHGKDPTTSTGTVISSFVCTVQALDSRRTSSRNTCC